MGEWKPALYQWLFFPSYYLQKSILAQVNEINVHFYVIFCGTCTFINHSNTSYMTCGLSPSSVVGRWHMQTTREEHCLYPTSVAPFLSFSWIGCTTNILEIKLNGIEDENWFDKVIVDILDWQRLWLTRRHFFFWTLKYKPFYSISVTTKAKRRRPAWIRVV